MKTLLLVLFILSCSKVETTEGLKEVSWFAERTVLTQALESSEVKNLPKSCYYCSYCYSAVYGKFTFSCFCSGSQRAAYNVLHYIRTYKIKDSDKVYTSLPVREEEHRFIENLSDCN